MVFCFPECDPWPSKKTCNRKRNLPSRKQNFLKISTLKIVPKTHMLENLVVMTQIGLVWSLSSHYQKQERRSGAKEEK
jgi:hypothetical protein